MFTHFTINLYDCKDYYYVIVLAEYHNSAYLAPWNPKVLPTATQQVIRNGYLLVASADL